MKKTSAVLFLLVLLIFGKLFLSGPKVAFDYPYWYPETLNSLFSYPSIWRDTAGGDGLGQLVGNSLFSWPVLLLYGFMGHLGFSFSVIFLLLGLLPFIILAVYGIYQLLTFYKIGPWGKLVAAIFYLANTYSLLLLDGGQVFLADAYALLPLCFFFFKELISKNSWGSRFKFFVVILIISFLDMRALFLVAILSFFNFIFDLLTDQSKKRALIINFLKTSIFIILTVTAIHSYWILPTFFSKSSLLPPSYGRVSQVNALSFSTLGHSILLLQPNWYKNIFGQVTDLKPEFFLIPILVFLAPVLYLKNRVIGFWIFISIISTFLAKGSNDPFGNFYTFAFANIPGFKLFRDSTKFFFLIALSYSILLAFVIDKLSKYKILKFSPLLILFYLIWLIRPIFLNQMTGIFSEQPNQYEYSNLSESLRQDNEFGRILWIPTLPPLGYSSPNHPTIYEYLLAEKRPFVSSIKGTYDTLNFLQAPFMGELFDVLGIKYVAYPFPDVRRENLKPDNIDYYNNVLNQLNNSSWATSKNIQSKLPVIRTKAHQDKFFVTNNLWWVIGSDDLYKESTKSADLKLSKNALVFAEEYPGLSKEIDQYPEASIVLNNKSGIDLAANYIDVSKIVFPAQNLDFNPNAGGWWKKEAVDIIDWRNFLQTKYSLDNKDFDLGGGWAVAEGNLTLNIKNSKLNTDNLLLARVMTSSRSGEIAFTQKDQIIGTVTTESKSETNFGWFEIGQLQYSNQITIKTKGDINVVNALASIKKGEWDSYKNKVNSLNLSHKITTYGANLHPNNSISITYSQINPTRYKVKVSDLTGPTFLVFSESYNSNWALDSKSSLPVYSLINGFRIDHNGEYELEFKLQKYLNIGLIISGLSIIMVLIVWFKTKNK